MENIIKMNGFEIHLLNGFGIDNEKKCIILNHTRNFFRGEIHPFKNNLQFIYSNYNSNYNGRDKRIMFGGMDESSFFITELQNKPFSIFKKQGEEAFYNSLVPKIIKNWSKKTGAPYGRQGDFFYTPLKLKNKYDFLKLALCIILHHPKAKSQLKKSIFGTYEYSKLLLNTRHKLEIFPNSEKYEIIEFPSAMFIAKGILSAPNHKPIILEEPHLIAQSNYLVQPD